LAVKDERAARVDRQSEDGFPEAGLVGVGCTNVRPVIDDDPVAIFIAIGRWFWPPPRLWVLQERFEVELLSPPLRSSTGMILELLGITA
jgi:hypothetical protein